MYNGKLRPISYATPSITDKAYYKPAFYKDEFAMYYDNHGDSEVLKTPQTIYEYLDTYVYGHDYYKKMLSVFVWKCVKNHRPNGALLVAGQSGSGKTEMIRALNEIYDNIYICDGSSITPQGYKGNSKLYSGLQMLDMTKDAPMPICVIDEVDKLIDRSQSGWNGTGLVAELLKLLEGGNVNIGTEEKPKIIDTSRIAFILLGSFSCLDNRHASSPIGFSTENIEKKSPSLNRDDVLSMIPPELKGRIEQTIILDSFNEDDYFKIMKDERYSPIKRIEREYSISISISNEKVKKISQDAFLNKTGVRSMNNEINEFVNQQFFENPSIKKIQMN
ncbi:AAA family ATPase [Butyrivibrio sp. VCD2006]|uniref:AAA family ATPase n=1 Tax=Butyrivibrio sp. VCD2006 TaxID=1280664 RepID=UPI00040BEC75|nr:AAA family ATPase [Butyrivibrio sp. VCD2006]